MRANCKYKLVDSKVSVPEPMICFKKTTLVKREGQKKWRILEDRVCSSYVTTMDTNQPRIDKMVVALQEARKSKDGAAYFCQQDEAVLDLEVNRKISSTMNQKQRKLVNECVQKIPKEDDAV